MKTILLIEDNTFIRENTTELLELAGYRVVGAENGQLGVEQALTIVPDLVVCDIMMPVLDGYGVLRAFNQAPQLMGIPFIFLTAKTERADLRQGMALGADDYLTKPFDGDELLSAIAGRLKRFQHLQPNYNLQADGLRDFLHDAQAAGSLTGLMVDHQPHAVARHQPVYAAGEVASQLYFVQAGRVGTSQAGPTGHAAHTSTCQPGEFFGYTALLQNTPRLDSAVAEMNSTLLHLPAADFMQLLLRDPEVSQRFVRLLLGRTTAQPTSLVFTDDLALRKPLADALLHLNEQQRLLTPTDPLIHLSRDDMAGLLGTDPDTLTRTLGELRRDGIVEATNGFVRVQQPERLRMRRDGW